VRRRESEIGEAEAELAAARDVFDRNRHLAASRAISRAELVESKSKAEMAQARMKQSRLPIDDGEIAILRHALTAVEREYAVRRAELDAKRVVKRGDAARLRKELANLELAQTRSVVRAPVDGIVVTGQIKPGDVIERGKPVYEIASQRGFHFEAAVPSEDIGQLEVGMQANVKFDAYDYQKFGTLAATVCFVSPDSSVAEGTEQSSGGASYLVRLKLHGDVVGRDGQLRGRVKLGLGGNAEIVADRETILMILLRNLRGTISLG
jgi:multidrug resistance efflux pump